MAILTNIFADEDALAAGTADQPSSGTDAADDAQVGPQPEPILPGGELGEDGEVTPEAGEIAPPPPPSPTLPDDMVDPVA